jgi:hypothetical protein
MTAPLRYSYAVHVLREDDAPVRQVPVEVDWEPAREAVRLRALQDGLAGEEAFTLECTIDPVWHPSRGQPYLGGFRVRAQDTAPCEVDFSLGYFRELGAKITSRLVAEGVLQKGDLIRCLPVAYPQAPEDAPRAGEGRIGRLAPPRIPVVQGSLGDFPAGGNDAAYPVFIPERVLEEVKLLTLAAEARETGGILLGLLGRDATRGTLFAEVTGQLPARHTEACATKLTFTPATWTEVQAALELRTRGELMVGWWHSHPVREWCKNCSEEKRAACAFAKGFLSEEDRLLHRTVFPRAYSLALLANDVAAEGPTYSLFGWKAGVLEQREFSRLTEVRHGALG